MSDDLPTPPAPPNPPGGGAGDLYAQLTIVVPPSLSEQEKKLYEELRDASRFDPRSKFKR